MSITSVENTDIEDQAKWIRHLQASVDFDLNPPVCYGSTHYLKVYENTPSGANMYNGGYRITTGYRDNSHDCTTLILPDSNPQAP
jgi:hypothetical protein